MTRPADTDYITYVPGDFFDYLMDDSEAEDAEKERHADWMASQ